MKILFKFIVIFSKYCFNVWAVIALYLLLITLLGVSFSYLEDMSLSDGLYFAFITSLSIGYGDITPTQNLTKVLAVITGLLGLLFIGLVVAIANHSLRLAVRQSAITKKNKVSD